MAPNTLDEIFKILVCSFKSMCGGTYPAKDWHGRDFVPGSHAAKLAGSQLAGGYTAALVCLQGDLEYLNKHLGLPRWNCMKSCCPLCKAEGSGPNTFKNFLPTAPWHDTEWTATSWRASDQRSKSKIFDLEHLNCWSVCLDLMHCKYLGTDEHQYASVLYLLVFEMMPHEPLQNLQQLWKEIKDLYRNLGVKSQYKFLGKISMFYKKSGECKLRGKASEVKYLGSVLQVLWERHRNAELEIHRMISCMLKLNTQLETILQDHKGCNALPPEEAAVFEQSCQKMCHLQCLLYDHFCKEDYINTPRLFPVTAKLHALVHISKLSRYINPQKVWCFAGEDFMHVCKILCKQCVHGTKPQLAPAKMVEKFRLAMHYELAS